MICSVGLFININTYPLFQTKSQSATSTYTIDNTDTTSFTAYSCQAAWEGFTVQANSKTVKLQQMSM